MPWNQSQAAEIVIHTLASFFFFFFIFISSLRMKKKKKKEKGKKGRDGKKGFGREEVGRLVGWWRGGE